MLNSQENPLTHKHALAIFYSLGIVLLGGICFAVWIKEFFIALIPLAGLIGLVFIVRPAWLYFIFIVILPFSMEFEFGGMGLDLPSEPILIGLALLGTLWFINNPDEAKKIIRHPISIAIVLHLIWVYCCILSSSNLIFSLKYALSKSWYILGSIVATYWMIDTRKKLILSLWLLTLSIAATVFIINIEHGLEGFTFDSIGAACNPLYRNHVIYGVFMVMILPFVFVLRFLTKKQSIQRLILDLIILLLIFGTYFSYTRGAWLALPVMLGVWFCIRFRLLRFLYPLGVVAGIAFFGYLSQDYRYLNYAPNYESTIYHDELGDHLSATFEGKDMSTMERFHRWIAAFRLFRENPVMGVGPNTFVDQYKPYTSTDFETYISENEERSTVHNYFIYVLAEQGLVGFLIIVFLVGAFFIYGEKKYHLLKNPLHRNLYLACILCGASFWLNNLFSDLLEANKLAPLWFFTIAWMLRIEQWDNKKTATAEAMTV